MRFATQRRISAQLLKCGANRIWFDERRLQEIKEAITKTDLRSLIKDKAIQKKPETGISSFRRRKRLSQKRKGRQTGQGTRKGKRTARLPRKRAWINKIRAQRDLLQHLKGKKVLSSTTFRSLYSKSTGGFFRSRRHILLFIKEHKLENATKDKKHTVQKKKTAKN